MTRANNISGLVLVGLGLSGCFSLDASLIADSGVEQPADAGERERDEDASDDAPGFHAARDAEAASEDGSSDAQVDTSTPVAPACSDDAHCLCSEQFGCKLREFERSVNDLAAANGALLILTDDTKDSLGNSRNDQEVLRWERPAAPVTLVRGSCEYLVQVTQSHVFCLDLAHKLLRLPITGTTATPERLGEGAVRRHWSTSTHLWWSVQQGSTGGLWRVALDGMQMPERLSTDVTRIWLTGSERTIYFTSQATGQAAVLFAQSPALTDLPRNLGPFHGYEPHAVADSDAVYFNTSYDSSTIMRTPLDGGPTTKLSNQNSCGGTFQVSGPHVYWQCNASPTAGGESVLHIARNAVAPPGEPQILVRAPIASTGGFGPERSFAVLDHSLVYIHPDDNRLYEVSF